MKVLLVLFFIYSTAMATRVKKEDVSSKEQAEIVNEANEMRRKLAKEFGIANANKLVYSKNISRPVFCKYSSKYKDPTERRFMWSLVGERVQEVMKEKEKTYFADSFQSAYNCFNPIQKTIGCEMTDCEIFRVRHVPQEFRILNCMCGPEDSFQKSDVKLGPAGSKCPGKVEDGLCVDGGSSGGGSSGSDNEGGSSSSIFSIGTLLLLAIFYLIF
uniref:SCP domain-containing protein n=1 Tax=Caenorhabditis tropicalis TaxID=1561998 RepID=A0A1I7UZ40_9PELO